MIDVKRLGEGDPFKFDVVVREGKGETRHQVTMAARYEFRERMRDFFSKYDLLVSPTLPVPAFEVGLNVPPQIPDANMISWVAYTYPFNLTGYPAASVPAGFTSNGLPVGLQIVGGPLREIDIFVAAAKLEESRPWADKFPPL